MSTTRPVILGFDAVSPLATDVDRAWHRAVAGESGVGPLTRFPLTPDFPVTVAGEVDEVDVSPYPFLSPRKLALWPSLLFKHSLLVVHRALKRAGLEITPDIAPDVAITYSAAVGGQDTLLKADRLWFSEGKLPKPYVNPNSCINMVGGKVSILTGATGPNLSTVTACATGSTSMVIAAIMMATGMAQAAICGGVDFPLIESIVAGFATMNGAYRTMPEPDQTPEEPSRASRPFAIDRRGFVVSEGAACLVLATKDFARAHGLEYDFELAGWSMTSDANHYVAPNLPTVARCMTEAIEHAGLKPSDIQAVNAHAASTKVGDSVEAEALKAVFGKHVPPVSANKSQIGHTMGAASAIEAIMAMQGMQRGLLLPTINYTPDPEVSLDCVSEGARSVEQEFILKNAFGFGGTNCCLVLKKV